MSDSFNQVINSHIWKEEPEPDNPFSAKVCICSGYDVYGDLLSKASYIEYLYLLFKGERPTRAHARLLEVLALALANPGPRNPSVHAAMAAGVGGSTAASALMAALACGAGSYGGAREVFLFIEAWREIGTDLDAWSELLRSPAAPTRAQVWPDTGHPPGFDPYSRRCALPVLQTLSTLVEIESRGCLKWLSDSRDVLETAGSCSLSMMGVAAAAMADLGFSSNEAEMLTLLLRLPGAAAHALEQEKQGFRRFPFFSVDLENDPKSSHQEKKT